MKKLSDKLKGFIAFLLGLFFGDILSYFLAKREKVKRESIGNLGICYSCGYVECSDCGWHGNIDDLKSLKEGDMK